MEIPIDLEEVADICDENSLIRDNSRWHVSNLISSAYLISKGDIHYHESDEPTGIMSLGRIWETAADSYLKHWANKRGGLYVPNWVDSLDDIVANLDGVMLLPDKPMSVVEVKLRFTMNNEIPIRHLQQIRAYCKVLDTTKAIFMILNISSAPPMAKARLELLEFTQQQIDENWQMLINTKRYLESRGIRPMARKEKNDDNSTA